MALAMTTLHINVSNFAAEVPSAYAVIQPTHTVRDPDDNTIAVKAREFLPLNGGSGSIDLVATGQGQPASWGYRISLYGVDDARYMDRADPRARVLATGVAHLPIGSSAYNLADLNWINQGVPGGGGGSISVVSDAGAAHQIREQDAVMRKGGRIGIGNTTAVALRFDHGTVNIRDYMLDLLHKYRLPGTVAHYSRQRTVRHPDRNDVPWETVQQWCINNGLEAWSHSATHEDATTIDGMYDEIVTSREELRASMPRVPVDGWCPPGIGAEGYNGGIGTRDPMELATEPAGQMIYATYGFLAGYYAGRFRRPHGRPEVSRTHYSWDSAGAWSGAIAQIQRAQATGTSIALMAHPEFIGRSDAYITWEQAESVFSFIAAERDAGRLIVLTLGGLTAADMSTTHRPDLLPPGGFGDLSEWETDGWTQTTEDGEPVLVSTVSSPPVEHTVSLTDQAWAVGGIFEATVEARVENNARVSIYVIDPADGARMYAYSQTDITPTDGWVELRQFCQLPLSGTQNALVRFARTNGGPVTLRRPTLRTA